MTTKTVWAAYFSATNTTKKVVTQIARRLSQQTACPMEIYDFTHPQARKTPKAFAPGDLVVFGTPVYAGRVPTCSSASWPPSRATGLWQSPWSATATETTTTP